MSRHRQVKNYLSRREWDYDDYDDEDTIYEEEVEEYNPYSYYNRGDDYYPEGEEEYYDETIPQVTLDELSLHKTEEASQQSKEETIVIPTPVIPTPTPKTTSISNNEEHDKKKKHSQQHVNSSNTGTVFTTKLQKQPQKEKPKKKEKKLTNSSSGDGQRQKQLSFKQTPLDEKVLAARVCRNYSIVVIGHVDAGKSTVIGHLLYSQGVVDERTHAKNLHESQKIGKQSFAFAWMMDEHSSERERGVTIDIAQKHLRTNTKDITILDAPGHKDFIPNMITGATHADAALLVVDASPGEFETGFDAGGQTREHVLLVRSLGIASFLVAVNKMDMIKWDEIRFKEVCKTLTDFFTQCGIKKKKVVFVPISGFIGQNLSVPFTESSWFNGPTLLQALDGLSVNERDVQKPLRMTIADTYRRIGSSALFVCGRLLSGAVCIGDNVTILPNNEIGQIKEIVFDGEEEKSVWAFAGDMCTLAVSGVDEARIRAGDLLCHLSSKPTMANKIKCKVAMFDSRLPLLHGTQITLHHQQDNVPAFVSLLQQLNKKSMVVEKEQPRVLTRNMVGVIELNLEQPLCIEPVEVSKDLARVLLRQRGVTVAGGVVLEASLELKEEEAEDIFSDDNDE
eukprot:m.106055 g.106055  ORF g.106055 m.106055 type:complete len:622 (-) comp9145_c0_seq3:27-1892(-)